MKVIIIVDYQVDFVTGSLGSDDARSIESAICSRLDLALESGWDIIFTMDVHGEDYLSTFEGERLPVRHCILGTGGELIYGHVADYIDHAMILEKDTFGCSRLLEVLDGYDEIELCGVATNVCVLSNAVMARTACPDARIEVRADCVASYDRVAGEKALDLMESIQVDVVR